MAQHVDERIDSEWMRGTVVAVAQAGKLSEATTVVAEDPHYRVAPYHPTRVQATYDDHFDTLEAAKAFVGALPDQDYIVREHQG